MRRLAAAVVCALALSVTTQARADATVRVKVRDGSDGRVELSGNGGSFGCTTRGGSCTIASVPGGQYVVVFRSKDGASTPPKKVVIPPEGTADLHIAAP